MKKLLTGLAIGIYVLGMVGMANATTYGGVDFPSGVVSFADAWISYNNTNDVLPPHDDPSKALGIPDFDSGSDSNYVSLGDGGDLVLQFTDNSLTTSGNSDYDLWIFEIGDRIEPTLVDISTNGINWINVGSTAGGTNGIDIDAYVGGGVILGQNYSFVRLTDLLPHQSGSPFEGADIDAVGAISSVPIPGAVWLLGSGLLGLMGVRRKKS